MASTVGLDERVVDGDLQLELGQEADLVLRAAVDLGEAALPPAAADVADGHEVDVAFGEGLLDGVELLGADDGDDEFHVCRRVHLDAPR